ncbi:MAG: M28 family peptidase [Acidimicrobiia bacterium]|nr:M28 family peptidase [Acidimicrobiia bacterium]
MAQTARSPGDGDVTMQAATGRMKAHSDVVGPVLIVIALLLVAVVPLRSPRPEPVDAAASEFSAARAIDHVEEIAREPHAMGSVAIERVRDYLIDELEGLGLEPVLQTTRVPDYFGSDESVELVNLMARIPGTDPTRAVALMGHYDTEPTTPGANDNAAAVAAIVETARALVDRPPLRNDVILLFTDGEEPAPRHGASAFVAEHPWLDDIGVIVNFEAVGGSGTSLLIETSDPDAWLVGEASKAAPDLAAFSFITSLVDLLGGADTDFAPFRTHGTRGLGFAYLQGSPIYHTEFDTVDRVSHASLQHHGSLALSLSRHFGDLDLDRDPTDGRATYFSIAGLTIRYPEPWAVPLGFLVLLAFGVAAARRIRAGHTSPNSLVRGAGVTTVAVLVGSVVAGLGWWALTAMRPMPSTTESFVYLAGLLVLAAAVPVAMVRLAERSHRTDRSGGAVLVWVVLTVLAALTLPSASYLFMWPALAGSLVLVWNATSPWQRAIRFAMVAAPAVILSVPAVYFLFELAQPRPGNPDSEIVAVVILPILLALLVAVLARAGWTRDDQR